MGNVYASSNGGKDAGLNVPPPPAPTVISPPTFKDETEKISEPIPNLENPGNFEELHKKCKDIFPMNFDGAKLLINKGLSNHFQISHTITMGMMQPAGYKFGCTYVGTKQYGPSEAYPVLMGEIDPSGNLNANVIHKLTKNLQAKFVAQIQGSKWVVSQLTADYRGKNCTVVGTAGNLDIRNNSGVLVAQYLQKLSPCLDLGSELVFQGGPQVPGGCATVLSFAGKYTTPDWQLSANASPASGAINACYYHRINPNLQVGVELETVLKMQESKACLGYQIDLPQADLVFKGQVDSNWCVGAVLEKKLSPMPFTFIVSGYANHVKENYRFGVGLMVG